MEDLTKMLSALMTGLDADSEVQRAENLMGLQWVKDLQAKSLGSSAVCLVLFLALLLIYFTCVYCPRRERFPVKDSRTLLRAKPEKASVIRQSSHVSLNIAQDGCLAFVYSTREANLMAG